MLLASALSGVLAAPQIASAQSGVPAAGSLGSTNAGAANPSEITSPNAPVQSNAPTGQSPSASQAIQLQTVRAEYKRLLLREKNSPSAVTELGSNQIAQVGVQGSVATVLRQAPSVYVYQQGIGNNEPVLSVRGIRGLETAQTYDGVPVQDLLNGGTGPLLNNVIGGRFNLDQISGVTIYPGVAFPSENTFGTIGGTIAYDSLRPSADQFLDVTDSVGSFGTFQEGFTLNTGKLNGVLGTGFDAPSILAKYSNLQTNGFIDATGARYNNFEFALDKPYDSGLSKFEATVLYNTGNGYLDDEPVPIPYLNQNGRFSNYPVQDEFARQVNQYESLFLKDRTYINQYLTVGGSLFYLPDDTQTQTYGNPSIFGLNGGPGSVTVQGASPFNQTPAGFGEESFYGPGGILTEPPIFNYNGNALYPPGSQYCPASAAAFIASGQQTPCGYNSEFIQQHTDTYGIQPRVTFTPPDIYGVRNTVIFGGLFAKETSPYSQNYLGITPYIEHSAANLIPNQGGLSSYDGGEYRAVYQGFAQDKIDVFHNTLHVTPGFTFESTATGDKSTEVLGGTPSAAVAASAYCQTNACDIGAYKVSRFDREWLPFLNIDYDLDRVLPAAKGTSLYASYGESALFAPVGDFGPNIVGSTPSPSIVHLYEAGVRYDTPTLLLTADYYYQKVDRDFGFFQFQSGPQAGEEEYTNDGIRQFQGQEASAVWQINPHWQLFGNVSHVLAKYLATSLSLDTIQEDQFGLAIRGSKISGVPDWLSTFGVDYDRKNQFLDGDEVHIRFEGQYTGQQATTIDVQGNTNIGPVPGFQPYGSYQYYSGVQGSTITNPIGSLAAFVVFNLDANYSLPVKFLRGSFLKSLDFDLNVLNIFNQQYFQYFYRQVSPTAAGNFTSGPFKGLPLGNYALSPEFADGIPGEPAAVTFTVTARF